MLIFSEICLKQKGKRKLKENNSKLNLQQPQVIQPTLFHSYAVKPQHSEKKTE